MKILLIDNFDSFTYNLVHYFEKAGCDVIVYQNNQLEEIKSVTFDKLVLSPGPKTPHQSGDLLKIIELFFTKKPILGVCLGMQALAHFTHDELYNLNQVKHGIQENVIQNEKCSLFKDIPTKFQVGLYHSWAVKIKTATWKATAYSENNVLMAFEHQQLPIFGVQFHPESILSRDGYKLIKNFVDL